MTTSVARRPDLRLLAVFGIAAVLLLAIFPRTLQYLWGIWQREEYSHGFLVPAISAYLIWQRRVALSQVPFSGSWAGVALVLAGLALYFVGSMASITTIDTYALVILVMGLALSVMGWRAFRVIAGPLALLFLMNPIPAFLFNNLSSALQLISSQIGVAVIRLFGISVFLEGNVIDLGSYKLQVVEACSGLRYLFPLVTLGVIVVSLIPARLWIRVVLVASTVPITVLMNSFRIGVIGVLVDRYGIEQAEGFLHDFEGWIIFMTCFALLLLETWLLLRLTGDRRSLRDLLSGQYNPHMARSSAVVAPARTTLSAAPMAALALVLLAVWPAIALPQRAEIVPVRQDLTTYPMHRGGWDGRRSRIESQFLDELKLDDYVMADYTRGGTQPVNFYIAYYASQRTGQAAHSPSSCLPGAGWRMTEFDQHQVPGVTVAGHPLRVNRTVIQMGEQRQLMYYWFQQRGRSITNEYAVKWFLLWDSLRINRTDGALVRVITPLRAGEPMEDADARLAGFIAEAASDLGRYIPE